jgi:ketosteroid isomerase-like protein
MRRCVSVFVLVILALSTAAAQDKNAVVAPVRQFVDAFNKGDAKGVAATCADQASIIDEFPPYAWHGANACAKWMSDFGADAKKNGVTEAAVTMGKMRHVDVNGDLAYVVVPTEFSFKLNGKPTKESGATLTIVLHKGAKGWLITAWTWTKG